jgi:hypothetical protein
MEETLRRMFGPLGFGDDMFVFNVLYGEWAH